MWKNVSITLINANTANKSTIPIRALVILALAVSKACLSPFDQIHWIDPVIIIKKNMIEAIKNAILAKAGIAFWKKLSPVLFSSAPKAGFPITPDAAAIKLFIY